MTLFFQVFLHIGVIVLACFALGAVLVGISVWLDNDGLVNLLEAIFNGINELINFGKRGFSNKRSTLYKVYRTENLCGDVSYTVGREYYLGRSRKPHKIEHLYDRIITHPNKEQKILQVPIDESRGVSHYSGNFFTGLSRVDDKKVVLNDYEEALQVAMDWKYKEERAMEETISQIELERKKLTTHTTSYTV